MKKLLSVLLCMGVLLSCVPMTSFAAQISAPVTQDFDDIQVGDTPVTLSDSQVLGLGVFNKFNSYGAVTTVEKDGYDGGNCLHITENSTDGNYFRIFMQPIPLEENKPIHTFFKFKVVDNKETAKFTIGENWNNYLTSGLNSVDKITSLTGANIDLVLDAWYDVHAVMMPGKTTMTISRDGVSISGSRISANELMITNSANCKGVVVKDSEIAIDEVEIYQEDSAAAPVVSECTPVDGTEKLSRKPEFEFKFDQLVGGTAAVTFEKYNETTSAYEAVTVASTTALVGRDVLKVTTNSLLDPESKYKVTLSGLKNYSETQTMTSYAVTFTTALANKVGVTTDGDGKLAVPSLVDGDGKVTATVAITDADGILPATADGIVLKYKGNKLVGIVEFLNDAAVTAGSIEVKFVKPTLAADESISILLFESTKNSFIPITSTINCKFAD